MSEDLWKELSNYDIYPIVNGRINNPEAINKHSRNFIIFDCNVCLALPFYQEIIDYERNNLGNKNPIKRKLFDESFIKYTAHKDNAIIRLITGLDVYLIDTFKDISRLLALEELDPGKLIDFIKQLKIHKDFIDTIRIRDRKIILNDILPKRANFNLQQKNNCKSAYTLINLEIANIADQSVWEKIFSESDGYMKMRHQIAHRGIARTIGNELTADYIKDATLNIARFVYKIDLKINLRYPKSAYPEIYPDTKHGDGAKYLCISDGSTGKIDDSNHPCK